MKDVNYAIKKRFVEFCGTNRISQRKMARVIGITPQNIGTWFSLIKDTMPTIFAINYLVTEYGLDANWLITGKKSNGEFQGEHVENKGELLKVINGLSGEVKGLSETINNLANKLTGKI